MHAAPVGSPARAGAQLRVGWGVGTVVGGDADDASVLHQAFSTQWPPQWCAQPPGTIVIPLTSAFPSLTWDPASAGFRAGPPQPHSDGSRTSADRGAPAKKRTPGNAALDRGP